MKNKILGISVVCFLLFMIVQFSELEVISQVTNQMKKGNEFFAEDHLDEASSEFLDTLVLTSLYEKTFVALDSQLNVNLGMTSYAKKQFLEANEYFDKTKGNYLLRGNGYYYLGELEQDPTLKIEQYSKALDMYKEGIIDLPRDIDLKFNYEFVLEKLNQEKQEQEQENQDSEENQEEQENQENQENQEGEEGQEDQEDQESQEGQEDQEDQEDQKSQEGEEGQEDQKNQEGQEGEESQEDQQNQQGEAFEGELTEEAYEELLKILELLEQQEEESLKNNQEVIQEGNGDTNDW